MAVASPKSLPAQMLIIERQIVQRRRVITNLENRRLTRRANAEKTLLETYEAVLESLKTLA